MANQNDIYNFLDMQRRRRKFIKLNFMCLDNEFINNIEIADKINTIRYDSNLLLEEFKDNQEVRGW